MTPRLLAAAAALLATTGALAETSPWYVGVAQGFTHTSNVRMSADGAAAGQQGSTISATTLLGGLDQPIGRQRLFGSATLRHLAYSGAGDLNNDAHTLALGLDWSTVERVSGRVQAQTSRQLELAPVDIGGQRLGQRNIAAQRSLDASVRVGVVTALTMEASFRWADLDQSLAQYDRLDSRSQTSSVGVRWRPSAALATGAALRHSSTKYPRYSAAGSADASSNHLDLTATWVASGASALDARLSFGRSRYDAASDQNTSGTTGALTWRWQPTGKIQVNTLLQRDTGLDTTLSQLNVLTGPSTIERLDLRADTSRLTTTLRSQVTYQVSGKVTATGSLRLARRSLSDRNTLGLDAAGSDRTQALNLGVNWAATRSVQLGCDLGRERRASSYFASLPYHVNTFGCQVQVVLQ